MKEGRLKREEGEKVGWVIVFRRGDDGHKRPSREPYGVSNYTSIPPPPPPPVEGKKEWPGQKFNYNGLV